MCILVWIIREKTGDNLAGCPKFYKIHRNLRLPLFESLLETFFFAFSTSSLTRVLDLIVCVPFRIHGFNVIGSVLVVKLGELRNILGINPIQFRNFLFCQTSQF